MFYPTAQSDDRRRSVMRRSAASGRERSAPERVPRNVGCGLPARRVRRPAGLLAGLLTVLSLAGCGGGVSIGIGIGIGDGFDDGPPSVSIAAASARVAPGASVALVAAASDGNGIDEVAFYRLDGNAAVRLGSDGSRPYEWTVVAPDDGRSTLRVFARATDGVGRQADSELLLIDIVR